ncbi:MAG TPA: PhzF family phenazine biosynthesis isomerase [Candidatus Limnocylindrales bacterium]|jgi:PhzF family phenazine biosynthesis protein
MVDATPGTLLRLAAFTTDPSGGNPAGVWIGDRLPPDAEMQRIAADVGYSETAFLAPDGSGVAGRFRVRYFSPLAEVPFCGHATIASGIALVERGLAGAAAGDGGVARIVLTTNGGPVSVDTEPGEDGLVRATLTSIAGWVGEPEPSLVAAALASLGWRADELDPALPPAIGFAGARHLIFAARHRERLERLEYAFDELGALMRAHDLTTIQLVWREAPDRFRARDPFPVGGVVEDPATGAAAAALGAYLRARGEITPPASFEIIQGVEMGRPSRLTVSVMPGEDGVRVSGRAVPIR